MTRSYNQDNALVTLLSDTDEYQLGKTSFTLYESLSSVEARITINVSTQNYLEAHALDKFSNKQVTIRVAYDNGVEFKSTFRVDEYERRISSKNTQVVHVFTGSK